MFERNVTRRSLLVGGAAAAGVGVLASCSGGGSTGGGGQVEIEYWHVNTETFGLPAIESVVSSFNEENDNITVTPRFNQGVYTGLLANLQTALAGGKPPALAQIGYLYTDYVKENFPYTPISELLEKFGPDDFLDQFLDTSLALAQSSDGEQFAVPYAISNIVMYINADEFTDKGMDPDSPPQTWPEWRELAEEYLDKTGKPLLYLQVLDDNWTNTALILSNGGSLLRCDDGTPKAAFNEPEATEAIQFWADLVADGLCLNVPLDQGEQEFIAGHVPVYATTIGKRASFSDAASFELKGTKWPSFPGKDIKLPAGGNELVVFAQAEEEQEAAWKFIQSLYSPEGITAWVEGTGYQPPVVGPVLEEQEYLGSYFEEYPIAELSRQQLEVTVPWNYFPGPDGLEAGSQGLFSQALQPALGGQMTAQEAADAGAATVDSAIAGETCEG